MIYILDTGSARQSLAIIRKVMSSAGVKMERTDLHPFCFRIEASLGIAAKNSGT
jgi:hypothetical protein